MNILDIAVKETGTHPFDIVLDAIDQEVPVEYRPFISPQHVIVSIRNDGKPLHTEALPNFIVRHCVKLIVEKRQLALL